MMRRLIPYILFFLVFKAISQSAEKTVVSNGGTSTTNAQTILNFTIGEPIVGLVNSSISVDQGFWAGGLFVESLQPGIELGGIVVYPNPVGDELNIYTNNNEVIGITLFAVNGQRVLKKKVEASRLEHRLGVHHLSKGVYVLRLVIKGGSEEKLFKVIKN
ncbi:T9SS type A sorting domain-containing protein [Flavobacteriaceae bacterium TP-CH-4]|uniref:T9SS type A sorting domain-containing protein n=1 Tax=Pelagihabitans pacificus TaxID=2696054 RepID=A0A967AWI6_9FLAO|nr:T9SS type A sorting domain-containing protein [Pelagihabitans pacificus]NHF60445.1 T9SS type A sorting domain-containing protein [Pelagihabitans pacificus]